MIPAVAISLGMSLRSLDALVEQGRVRTESVLSGHRQYWIIPEAEIERLKAWCAQKRLRKMLIEGLALKAGISRASARRWVERQEAKGFGREAIRQRVAKRLQRLQGGEEREE